MSRGAALSRVLRSTGAVKAARPIAVSRTLRNTSITRRQATLTRPLSTAPHHCLPAKTGQIATPVAESPAPLSPEQYHKLSDAYIETLLTDFEELQEEDEEVDVEYSAGVLNLKIPYKGTYVINKQPPNKQIWLSSPISGPKRFDYVLSTPITEADQGASSESEGPKEPADLAAREDTSGVEGGEWIYLRDGTSLSGLLREELGVELQKLDDL